MAITVSVSGGLGNQFFQYAAGRRIQSINSSEKKVIITYKDKTHPLHADRDFSLSKYELCSSWKSNITDNNYYQKHKIKYFLHRVLYKLSNYSLFTGERIQKIFFKFRNMIGIYEQINSQYYPLHKSYSKDIYISGMWHNAIYSSDNIEKIRSELTLKPEFYTDNLVMRLAELKSNNAVAVHVRRGDYLKLSTYIICSADYYINGMRYIKSKVNDAVFYVFSDDIAWCKDNLKGEDIVYIDENNPDYIDMELMRNCNHFILSNSTFSWWGAYLSDNESKLVVLPKYWKKSINKDWLALSGWVIMDNN